VLVHLPVAGLPVEELAAGVLDELMRLPETLSAAPTLETMKRVLSEAGLTFQSDADEKAP
jgi:hypothetical protein